MDDSDDFLFCSISPKATDPPSHNPLFIYPTHNFPKLLDIPAYVNSLDSLDEINQQSEEKMKSYILLY